MLRLAGPNGDVTDQGSIFSEFVLARRDPRDLPSQGRPSCGAAGWPVPGAVGELDVPLFEEWDVSRKPQGHPAPRLATSVGADPVVRRGPVGVPC